MCVVCCFLCLNSKHGGYLYVEHIFCALQIPLPLSNCYYYYLPSILCKFHNPIHHVPVFYQYLLKLLLHFHGAVIYTKYLISVYSDIWQLTHSPLHT